MLVLVVRGGLKANFVDSSTPLKEKPANYPRVIIALWRRGRDSPSQNPGSSGKLVGNITPSASGSGHSAVTLLPLTVNASQGAVATDVGGEGQKGDFRPISFVGIRNQVELPLDFY